MGVRLAHLAVVACTTSCVSDDRPGPDENPAHVVDSSGSTFAWDCDRDGCQPLAEASTPAPPSCTAPQTSIYSFRAGRFVVIAAACTLISGGWASYGRWQRTVSCSTDRDCPQLYQFTHVLRFECRNSLCQNTDRGAFPQEKLLRFDAEPLCYGAFGRDETAAAFAPPSIEAAAWVDSACGPAPSAACELPLPGNCLQP
jgi:hypothetical protein